MTFDSVHMTDKYLMKMARRRVVLRRIFKWICAAYITINAILVSIWLFLAGRGYFWPGWVMAGMGIAIVILGVIFKALLSIDTKNEVLAEYKRLKHSSVSENSN